MSATKVGYEVERKIYTDINGEGEFKNIIPHGEKKQRKINGTNINYCFHDTATAKAEKKKTKESGLFLFFFHL